MGISLPTGVLTFSFRYHDLLYGLVYGRTREALVVTLTTEVCQTFLSRHHCPVGTVPLVVALWLASPLSYQPLHLPDALSSLQPFIFQLSDDFS